ncbi:MAG: beta-galactosidase, partial [Clostridia bacterium]|nr:beta-galactosidase [Clostridia bacterium]
KVLFTASYKGKVVGRGEAGISFGQATTQLKVDEVHLWAPFAPEIYDLKLELADKNGKIVDTVESYFALRDVSLTKKALTINNKPVFMRTILDQGFHRDGIYTAPSDDVLRRDIEMMMELGFNGARFHRRVFEERSLYWADMLGYIIWGEYSSLPYMGGPESLYDLMPEWIEFVKQYYNHPSVIGWMCFNETYHKIELDLELERMFYNLTKTLDPYRPVIEASGGVHVKTDMYDVHEYCQKPETMEKALAPMLEDPNYRHVAMSNYRGDAPGYEKKDKYEGQPYWLSEVGGTFFPTPDEEDAPGWGYGKPPADEEEFIQRYEGRITVMLNHPRICGFCYTQLTDVEQEQNGIYSYNRKPKFSKESYERIRKANLQIAAIEKEDLLSFEKESKQRKL